MKSKKQQKKEAWRAFRAIEDPAWEAYKAIYDPAWEVYLAIHDPAWETYKAKCKEIDEQAETVN